MRVCIVGSGGREDALARTAVRWGHTVTVSKGRHGMPNPTDTSMFDLEAELFVIGSENDLVDGQADVLRAQGKLVLGPGLNGARLEGSKAWMKMVLDQAGVPTADWDWFGPGDEALAEAFLRERMTSPYVVKTSYLAAGKGALVTPRLSIAVDDAKTKLQKGLVVIEEGLDGEELSFFAVCDETGHILLPFAQDYKRVGRGDQGPNTGGTGAYAPVFVEQSIIDQIHEIVDRTLLELRRRGIIYRGILYGGAMLTADGLYLLEYNIRLGDPEAEVILPIMTTDPISLFARAASGLLGLPPRDHGQVETQGACVCIVLMAEGYPDNPVKNKVITGIEEASVLDGITVLHAGTRFEDGKYLVDGGRVLDVVAEAQTVPAARALALQAAELIHWEGMHYREDIAEGVD